MTKEEAFKKIDELKEYINELNKERTYKSGDRFPLNKEEYILSLLDNEKMCLISLEDGKLTTFLDNFKKRLNLETL